jgi:hypothetical protein
MSMTRKELLYATLALAGGMIGGVMGNKLNRAAAATEAIPKRIAAQELQLVDAHGRMAAALTVSKEGEPSFAMYDHSGKLRTDLSIGSGQELGLKLYDAKGAMRISMMISAEGIPAMRLFDPSVRPRALIGVDSEGEPAMDFYTSNGRLMRELP